jgi:hypothetical protein
MSRALLQARTNSNMLKASVKIGWSMAFFACSA